MSVYSIVLVWVLAIVLAGVLGWFLYSVGYDIGFNKGYDQAEDEHEDWEEEEHTGGTPPLQPVPPGEGEEQTPSVSQGSTPPPSGTGEDHRE